MESCEELQSRWRRHLERGEGGCCFDLDKLATDKFYVLYGDYGCTGTCSSDVQVLGSFDDARDFLAFIRHVELPRILDYASGDYRDIPNISDAYLLDLQDGLKNKVDWLFGLLDRALKAPMISESELSTIFSEFNQAFEDTNPTVQIVALGTLVEVLSSDHFEEEFEEDMEDEVDEDEKPVTTLKRLLDAGEFNENNEVHLALAKGFLERSMVIC